MLEVKSIRAIHFEAELREEDGILCRSGQVSLGDDDWVCLSTIETAGGVHKFLDVGSLSFLSRGGGGSSDERDLKAKMHKMRC